VTDKMKEALEPFARKLAGSPPFVSGVQIALSNKEHAALNELLAAALASEPEVSEDAIALLVQNILSESLGVGGDGKINGCGTASFKIASAILVRLSRQQPAAEVPPSQDDSYGTNPTWPGKGGGDD